MGKIDACGNDNSNYKKYLSDNVKYKHSPGCVTLNQRQNLQVVLAEFSTLSQAILLYFTVSAWHTYSHF